MNTQSDFVLMLKDAFYGVFESIVFYTPNVIVAVILFIVGWFLASWVGKIITSLVSSLKIDDALAATGLNDVIKHSGFTLNTGKVLGGFIKWVLILVVATVSFNIIGLPQVNGGLAEILGYIPNIIVAAVILIITALIADVVAKFVTGSAKVTGVAQAGILGTVSKYAVWVIGIATVLTQLQIAGLLVSLFESVFTGIIAAVAIAVGISFGLGGKETAAKYIARMEKDLE